MGFLTFGNARASKIDRRIKAGIGVEMTAQMVVCSAEHPAFRYVDLFNAIEGFAANRAGAEKIETEQVENLNSLLFADAPEWTDRTVRPAGKEAWPTGPKRQSYLPNDCFWLCPSAQAQKCFVIRLKFLPEQQVSLVEVACGQAAAGERALEHIIEHARIDSIYRRNTLHLTFETAKRDEFGDVEKAERLQVLFSAIEPVTGEDIVLDEAHLKILRRNVLDLHARRDILRANQIPVRRGILLHGPPGTGKTFACRYLCSELRGVTRIFVTGSSLVNVGACFSLARLLQPVVLFLEDVDLVFMSREIGQYSNVLGDLLDNMDGLRAHEEISVVLTTNSIERLEAAIKDRPGRISQCLFMGAPGPEMRGRYIAYHLGKFDARKLELDELVSMSEGTTQAFMKEWVHRAVQIACERLEDATQRAQPENADFSEAMIEMQSHLEGADGKFIGFSMARRS